MAVSSRPARRAAPAHRSGSAVSDRVFLDGRPGFVLVMGANGAGKSTGSVPAGASSPRSSRTARCADRSMLCEEAAGWRARRLEERASFGIETTFTRAWRHRLVREAVERGYSLTAVFLGTSRPAVNTARVRRRHRLGEAHLVAPSTIRRRGGSRQRLRRTRLGSCTIFCRRFHAFSTGSRRVGLHPENRVVVPVECTFGAVNRACFFGPWGTASGFGSALRYTP